MRNLLINLTFIFILVLGSASDAFSQRNVGIIDIFITDATFSVGIIDIFNIGDRVANEEVPLLTITVSSMEDDINFIEHSEDYTFSDMKINISQEEIDKLITGYYLLTVKIGDTLVGTEKVLIE